MNTVKTLIEYWQPKPITNLVESVPVQEGTKLSGSHKITSWEDLRGLTWLLMDDWS